MTAMFFGWPVRSLSSSVRIALAPTRYRFGRIGTPVMMVRWRWHLVVQDLVLVRKRIVVWGLRLSKRDKAV